MIGYKEHWLGIECEGRYSGMKTVFIGDISTNMLDTFVPKYPHIYFCSTATTQLINNDVAGRTWEWFLNWILDHNILVTLEVNFADLRNVPAAIRNKVHIMYMYHDSDFDLLKSTDSIKVVHDSYSLHCITKYNMQKVTSDGYTNDK